MKNIDRKNMLITGASSGVGEMLVRELKKSYNITTISRRTEMLLKNNPEISAYSCDISNENELLKTVDKIKKNIGSFSYIINCAGILNAGELDNEKLKELNYSIAVNAIAPMFIINSFLPEMKKDNFGRIINLTSGAPLNCFAGFSLYSTSKAALNSLTVTLAREIEKSDISLNLMSPGPVKSEMSPNAIMEPIECLSTVKYLLAGNGKNKHNSFYWLGYKIPLFPDLEGINWLEGIGNNKVERVI